MNGMTARPMMSPVHNEAGMWWRYARATAVAFLRGAAPPEIHVFGPAFGYGENAYFQGTATYSRMYGGDGSYTTTGLFAFGGPAFTIGALAANGYVNHRRKLAAQRAAAVQWREHQQVGIIGTSHRLLINTAQSGWLPFDYGAVTEYYPDLTAWSLTMGFGGESPPLRLIGPPVPAAAVLVSVALAPGRWHHDPRLAPLLRS